jgi:hypothetical protein
MSVTVEQQPHLQCLFVLTQCQVACCLVGVRNEELWVCGVLCCSLVKQLSQQRDGILVVACLDGNNSSLQGYSSMYSVYIRQKLRVCNSSALLVGMVCAGS